MTTYLILLLFALVFPFICAPILVRRHPGISAEPCLNQIPDDHARQLFPPRFFWLISELEALGFSFVTHLASGDEVTKVNALISLLVDPKTKTTASIARVSASNAIASVAAELVSFTTEFEDGSRIETSNSPTINVFRELPHRLRLNIPQIKDAYRLFHIHLNYVQNRTDCQRVLPEPGKELEYFIACYKKELAEQAELGFLYLDERTQRYCHSWRSAILSTWKLLWPVKPIVLLRKARRGRLIARASGISNL
jgi:hypothetical protein